MKRLFRRRLVVGALIGLVALGALAWLLRPRDDPKHATVGDAVQAYRAGGEGKGVVSGPGEPALGVYRYSTRGSESADTPLLGATHRYRGLSTITLAPGRCGEVERWQVLDGRWTELESCPTAKGYELATVTENHEFFGIDKKDTYRCAGGSMATPPVPRAGARFSSSCESESSSIEGASRVVGLEPVSVDGQKFDAIHTVSQIELEGDTAGLTTREDWRRRSDHLLLRRVVSTKAELSLAGGTDYDEHYSIHLLGVSPIR